VISPVSNQPTPDLTAAQPATHQTASATKPQPAQDSVQLSPQAKAAASGDVDHDGDSH
jgi:hypothetical protein